MPWSPWSGGNCSLRCPVGWSDADLGAAEPAGSAGSAGYTGVCNVASAGIGIYPGDGAAIAQMQNFAAKRAEYGGYPNTVDLYGDSSSQSNFLSSIWGEFIQAGTWESYGANKPQITISTPLGFGAQNPTPAEASANFNAITSGTYDSAYQYEGNALVAAGYSNAIIRLGWEMNGNWYPWEATNAPSLYVAAYQHVHDVLAAIPGSAFKFDWCGDAGQSTNIMTEAYPGDSYVDYVGMDIYDKTGINVSNELSSIASLAETHDKQVSYPEWALCNVPGDDPSFIQAMSNFMNSLPASGAGSLGYESYFMGDPSNDNTAPHSFDGNYPLSETLYRQLFTDSNVYTVAGAGTGFGSGATADQFNYADESFSGDGTEVVRVTGMYCPSAPSGYYAGEMFRNDTTAGSKYAAVTVSNTGHIDFRTRTSTNGAAASTEVSGPGYGPSLTQPIWLELVRSGSSFTAYYGTGVTEPSTWTQVGSATTVNLNTSVLAGLAVTGASAGYVNTANIDNVSIIASIPAAPSSLTATVVSSSQINLSWTNNANNQTGFYLDQATNSTFTSGLVTYTTSSTSYNDTGLTAGTTYYFRVRAYNGVGSSSNSNTASGATPSSGSSPSGWSDTDVNGSTPAGSASYSSSTGVYTITGGGTGYHASSTSDQFNYCSESWTGSGTIVAEVTSLTPTTPNAANCAVMFRNDTTAGSMYAGLGVDTSGGMAFKTRTSTGGSTGARTPPAPATAPPRRSPSGWSWWTTGTASRRSTARGPAYRALGRRSARPAP